MNRVAVYAATFDPFTNGHLDIANRAALLFDSLIVAVYATPSKNVLFDAEERLQLVRESLKNHANVRVEPFEGLLVEYMRKVGARVVIRGLRTVSDFEYELQMAHMNRELWPDCEVVCLITSKSHSFISASLIREIASLGADLDSFVPPHVARALKNKYGA
jgi:pantetheine-phosphate adenylyltransferase